MKDFAYLDIETSGLDPKEDEIIKFVVGLVRNNEDLNVIKRLAKPKKPLSAEVEKLTGITNEQLNDCEPSDEVKTEILAMLEGRTIIGTNIDFIELFLETKFEDKIELSDKLIANKPLGDFCRYCLQNDLSNLTKKDIMSVFSCEDYEAEEIKYLLEQLDFTIKKTRKKYTEKDFFGLEMADRVDYLTKLIDPVFLKYDYEEIFPRLRKEIVRIQDLGLVEYFVVARSLADILRVIDLIDCESQFVGVGSASLIAYCLGITDDYLDPIKHCLIFERAFGEGMKNYNAFNFFIPNKHIAQVQQELENLYGECKIIDKNDSECVLQVHNVKINVYTSKIVLNDGLAYSSELVSGATVGVFQEDYMRLLHLVGKFSYDEANQIRLDIAKRNKEKIEEHKKQFIKNARVDLPLFESQDLFDKIVLGLKNASCKAWYLSVENISPNCVKFAEELLPF